MVHNIRTTIGKLEVGNDGDVLVLDPRTLQPNYVFALGQVMKTPTWYLPKSYQSSRCVFSLLAVLMYVEIGPNMACLMALLSKILFIDVPFAFFRVPFQYL
jgi:hypothetical protein